jgi:hypothetical protein
MYNEIDQEEMPMGTVAQQLKVADEVWVATALLHREYPKRQDFSVEEIMERAGKETSGEPLRPGVRVHVNQHCVANRPPDPGRYRMLFETAPSRRRLFRTGDAYHPARDGAKTVPQREDVPREYFKLLEWYREWDASAAARRVEEDPILALVGSGKHIWGNEDPDEYVRSLREGWE